MNNAILRVRCPDRKGIIAALSDFVFRHGGNILDLDQHTEPESGRFFMRLVWSLDNFNLDAEGIRLALEVLARGFGLHWELNFDDARDRVAIFCSKQPHCLYDLLLRQRLGELAGDIVLVASNHPDARPAAEYFGLPFVVVPVEAEAKERAEARQQCFWKNIASISWYWPAICKSCRQSSSSAGRGESSIFTIRFCRPSPGAALSPGPGPRRQTHWCHGALRHGGPR